MRKALLVLFLLFFVKFNYAQDVILTFDGVTGDPSVNAPLDKVIIENLTKKESIELTDPYVINLTSLLGLNDNIQEIQEKGFQKVYPNPTDSAAFVEFYSEGMGETTINFYNILGQSVANFSERLNKGLHKLEFTPQYEGIYLIELYDNGHKDFSKLIATKNNVHQTTLLYVNKNTSKKDSQTIANKVTNDFTFDIGDELKYTGFYGSLTNGIYDSPTESRTVTFSLNLNLNGGDTLEQISKTNTEAVSKLNEILIEYDFIHSLNTLKDWLESSPNISEADISDGNVEIKYNSGLLSFVIISLVDEEGNRTKGGGANTAKTSNKSSIIKLEDKNSDYISATSNLSMMGDENIITDRDVFIYEPFESDFQQGEGTAIKTLFDNANLGFNPPIHLKNEQCTLSSLSNLTDYGFIYFSTHGVKGNVIWTRERLQEDNEEHENLMFSEKLILGKLVEYKTSINNTVVEVKDDFWGVTAKYISDLNGDFPNSVIFNSSCQSTKTDLLYQVFKSKMAKTYLGFDRNVWEDFSKEVGVKFVTNLLTPNLTTGEAFFLIYPKQDPRPLEIPFILNDAIIEILGDQNITFHEESDLSKDAKNIRLILGNAGVDVSSPLWDSTNDADLVTILQQNGCYVQNGRVYYINWNNKSLGSISAEIGQLTGLQHLLLINNGLNNLPQEIGSLSNLLELTVNNNNLTSIDSFIGNLQSLTDLFWTNNGLTTVPAFIGNMNTLDNVHFENNSLTSVSADLGNLTNLNFLVFYTNPTLLCLPQSVWDIGSAVRTSLSTGDTDCSS
ncbi:hypothetical protein GCM10023311_13110 [Flaviramulus aquimarinus]|uniref:Por secretion system C-terminal sorting domain-containing protein n=1 Tax=Flaviramulus aquimarinus TaxID=1170456 RepID=A0ABP9EYF7_9FLAO